MRYLYLTSGMLSLVSVLYFMTLDSLFMVIAAFSLGIYLIYRSKQEKTKELDDNEKESYNIIHGLFADHQFKVSQIHMNRACTEGIAFDQTNKQLAIIEKSNDTFNINYFSDRDILESEVVEDGISVTKTSRGSQIGGALVGGVLAGGVGAIVGGLSGTTTTQDEIRKMQLQITVKNFEKPIRVITFFKSDYPIKKSNVQYKEVIEKVKHWHKVISLLITKENIAN